VLIGVLSVVFIYLICRNYANL